MKLLVVAVALVAAVSCASVGSVGLDKAFQEWKVKFEKVYSSPEEEAMRKQIWMNSWNEAEAHNARYAQGLETWTMGMTQFSDMTGEEFVSRMGTPHLDNKQRHLIAKCLRRYSGSALAVTQHLRLCYTCSGKELVQVQSDRGTPPTLPGTNQL